MKAIVCEMCASRDLVKQDGMYVCQNCGTKYTTEEAKKMMVEIDNSKKLSNLYERARKSLEVDDLEHAAEYFKQILDENPNDWEAYFYTYLGEFTSYTNAQAASVASKLGTTIPAAYDMAVKDCEKEEAEKRVLTISKLTANRLMNIASTAAALLGQYEGGSVITAKGSVHRNLYNNLRPIAQSTIINCVFAFDPLDEKVQEITKNGSIGDDVSKQCLLTLRRVKYTIASLKFSPASGMTEHMVKSEFIQDYARKVKELDPDFEMPSESETSSSGGGCYVATAVYGSYDCPQVWVLRRYRDYELAETGRGRLFIHVYYTISPILVKLFGQTDWFKKLWKGKLDHMVLKLREKGYDDTPYEDRNWR